jgi:hypothetical protein
MDNQAAETYLLKQGIAQCKIEVAKNMLVEGCDISLIEKVTGLSRQTIEQINKG